MNFGMDGWKLIIPHSVYHKTMWWVNMAKGLEVSGFGTIQTDFENKTFRVLDSFLFKQENTPGDTELDPDGLNRAMFECHKAGQELKWWWHSHHRMSCFWSGTDRDTIKQLGERGWILATVFNQDWQYKSAFYTVVNATSQFSDKSMTHEVFIEDLKTEVITYLSNEDIAKWEAQYNELCTEKKWSSSPSNYLGAVGTTNQPRLPGMWNERTNAEEDGSGRLPLAKTDAGVWHLKDVPLEQIYDNESTVYLGDPRFWWRREYEREGVTHPGRWHLRYDVEEFERAWNRGNTKDEDVWTENEMYGYMYGGYHE